MQIHVDYNPSPKDHFFISVPINDTECISFDKTLKGHRVLKQVLQEKKAFPADSKFDSEWDTIVLENEKFIKKYHVQWIDKNSIDWVNEELWKTVWEKPISQALSENLLYYSRLVSDHHTTLEKYGAKMQEFEELLKREIAGISDS